MCPNRSANARVVLLRPTARAAPCKPPSARVQRPGLPHDLQPEAAHEAAPRVGLVELVAEDDRADRPARSSSSVSGKTPPTAANGWNIRFLPTSPLRFARPSGNCARARVQQQARRADAVAGDDRPAARAAPGARRRVVVERRRAPGRRRSTRDLAHAAAGAQLDAEAQRQRPVGHVGAGARAGRAAEVARAADVARPAGRRTASDDDRRRRRATSASRACRSRAPSSRRAGRAAAAASGAASAAAATGRRPVPETPIIRSFRS